MKTERETSLSMELECDERQPDCRWHSVDCLFVFSRQIWQSSRDFDQSHVSPLKHITVRIARSSWTTSGEWLINICVQLSGHAARTFLRNGCHRNRMKMRARINIDVSIRARTSSRFAGQFLPFYQALERFMGDCIATSPSGADWLVCVTSRARHQLCPFSHIDACILGCPEPIKHSDDWCAHDVTRVLVQSTAKIREWIIWLFLHRKLCSA